MTQDMECNFAIIEFGECDKESYLFIKGGLNEDGEKMAAHTYWYPDDLTNEEINQEILDLCEHYENVAIVLPIPAHAQIEGVNA